MPVTRRNLLVAAALAVLAAGLAVPLAVLPSGGPGLWSGLVLEIQTVQRDLHRQLGAAMQAVRAEGAAAAWALIGLRPCSGAVLVLLVAYSLDLRRAGVAAVLAMSLGTAITVSLLPILMV